MRKSFFKYVCVFSCIALLAFLAGCGGGKAQSSKPKDPIAPQDLRPNTAVVLIPEATGTAVHKNGKANIDYSNANQGYIIAQYLGDAKKTKILITGPDQIPYQYIMSGQPQVFPLTSGDGEYVVGVHENIAGDSYSTAFSCTIAATLEDPLLPYLYPNIYVNFNKDTQAIKMGEEVAKQATNELDVVANVYNYVMELMEYDYEKAEWAASGTAFGYASDPDETMNSKKGICFDYAALMATMLRTQGIPTNLQVGWAGTIYHAWVNVYIEDIGWVNGLIQFDGTTWKIMDPTFADGDDQSKEIMDFISTGSNYQTKYKY